MHYSIVLMYNDSKEFDDSKKNLLTWLLISHFLSLTLSVRFRVRFSVGGTSFSNAMELPGISFLICCNMHKATKHCWFQVHLFRIKLNALLALLPGHFILNETRNMQVAISFYRNVATGPYVVGFCCFLLYPTSCHGPLTCVFFSL